MTASELNRKLLYRGYDDMVDYLRNSPLNRMIYQVLLTYGPKPMSKLPMLTIFNEAYYQLFRINIDSNPGVDLRKRYLDEEEAYLGSHETAMVVFNIVWALIRRKWDEDTSFNEKCFQEEFYPIMETGQFPSLSYIIIKFTAGERLLPSKKFRALPSPISELPDSESPENKDAWREVTNNFSYKMIERYLRLFATKEEQQALLKIIEGACTDSVSNNHKSIFPKLRANIDAGKYPQEKYDSEDFSDGMELTYKEELEALKVRYKELQNNLQYELSSREYKYKDELDQLRAEMEHKSIFRRKKRERGVFYFSATEMIEHAKSKFSKSAADEFSLMLYQLALKHGYIEEGIGNMIDEIVPAVLTREAKIQKVDLKTAENVFFNPERVEIKSSEDDKK